MINQTTRYIRQGLPWIFVGILLTMLWQSQRAGAAPPPRPLLDGPPPGVMRYQAVLDGTGASSTGRGQFKFAIVDSAVGDGTVNYWSNDGTASGEPGTAVNLEVTTGQFDVYLGDAALGMVPLDPTVFRETDTYLRVWVRVSTGAPFQPQPVNVRLASVPYALRARVADNSLGSLTCTTDQIAKFDGTSWVCSDSESAALETRLAALERKLERFSVSADGNDITISGANLHVVNGEGSTETTNGLGNVIVGYNEPRAANNNRGGSHMLVIGKELNYYSYGGIVAGLQNSAAGRYASVYGGQNNQAFGYWSTISGGRHNMILGDWSSISGGGGSDSDSGNTVSGDYASVSAGASNHAWGDWSSVSGGLDNDAGGNYASVSGGRYNVASGNYASVSGGGGPDADFGNRAGGDYASVSGGRGNTAYGRNSSVSGGRYNVASGNYASVSGGGGPDADSGNRASGDFASVSGGGGNTAVGYSASVSGGQENRAFNDYASVSGGQNNVASGQWSSVSGGGG